MKPPKKFGEVLSELVKSKRISLSTLGEQTGGKALLRHAMQDELPEAKRGAMYQRLCELNIFTEDELSELETGLIVSRMGVRDYLTKAALLNLMSNDVLLNDESISNEQFVQRIQAAACADTVRIICAN